MAASRSVPQPSDLELQVLSVLWREGPATVRRVMAALPDKKPRAYTSVLSAMQVMEKKGLLDHERQGNTHIYRPMVTRRQVLGPLMRQLVRNVFGGRPSEAMAHLLSEQEVTAEELDEIRRLLDATPRPEPKRKGRGKS